MEGRHERKPVLILVGGLVLLCGVIVAAVAIVINVVTTNDASNAEMEELDESVEVNMEPYAQNIARAEALKYDNSGAVKAISMWCEDDSGEVYDFFLGNRYEIIRGDKMVKAGKYEVAGDDKKMTLKLDSGKTMEYRAGQGVIGQLVGDRKSYECYEEWTGDED